MGILSFGKDFQKTKSPSKSYITPGELGDLDLQNPSRFLDQFGDQYQRYSQQYGSPYGRYYGQGSGSRYSGLADQMYPGSQNQRLYPQQSGYLDLGYPSAQYDFSEFDPSAYTETETYPGSHDIFRPDTKVGYEHGQGKFDVVNVVEQPQYTLRHF